jgi:hypothetical protein
MSDIQWHDVREDVPQVDENGEPAGWIQTRTIGGIVTGTDGQRHVRFVSVPLDATEPHIDAAKQLITAKLAEVTA